MVVYHNFKQFKICGFYFSCKQPDSTYFVEYLFYNHLFTHSKYRFSKRIIKSWYDQFHLRLQIFIHFAY